MTGLLPVVLGRPIPTRWADPVVQHQRRFSRDDISELVHRCHDAETIDSLAGAFGVHRTTVMALPRRTAQSSSDTASKSVRTPTRKEGRSSRAIAASTSKSTDQ